MEWEIDFRLKFPFSSCLQDIELDILNFSKIKLLFANIINI